MGLLDAISPTPRNRILGLLADATQGVNDFASKPFGYDNPPARMLMGLLGVPSIATTLDRLSYGEPLTNIGKANVPLLKPETADAAMAAAAALPAVSRGALKASDAAVRAITRNPEATATKVMDYAAQMNPMNPMVVYHGSPHKFDKFDSSKIGTGEGAQAYGHGLYLAESDRVAKQYADTLTDKAPRFLDGVPADQLSTAQRSALGMLADAGGNANAALLAAKTDMARAGGAGADFHVERYNTLRDIARGKSKAVVGEPSLYKVDLPDSAIAKMLDWDKPLSQQPAAVQSALQDSLHPTVTHWATNSATNPAYNGADLWARLSSSNKNGAAELLRQQGIPGIRYLDGGSRGAGAGTSNFVVFPGEESLLSILERNGVPVK